MKKELSCGVIPFRKRDGVVQVLLILHQAGMYWGFPKGHLEQGETGLEAALRELKEETGLEVERLLSLDPYQESYTFTRFNETIHKTVQYYPAFVQGNVATQEGEVIEARWVSAEEAKELLTFDQIKFLYNQLLRSKHTQLS